MLILVVLSVALLGRAAALENISTGDDLGPKGESETATPEDLLQFDDSLNLIPLGGDSTLPEDDQLTEPQSFPTSPATEAHEVPVRQTTPTQNGRRSESPSQYVPDLKEVIPDPVVVTRPAPEGAAPPPEQHPPEDIAEDILMRLLRHMQLRRDQRRNQYRLRRLHRMGTIAVRCGLTPDDFSRFVVVLYRNTPRIPWIHRPSRRQRQMIREAKRRQWDEVRIQMLQETDQAEQVKMMDFLDMVESNRPLPGVHDGSRRPITGLPQDVPDESLVRPGPYRRPPRPTGLDAQAFDFEDFIPFLPRPGRRSRRRSHWRRRRISPKDHDQFFLGYRPELHEGRGPPPPLIDH